MISKNYKGGKIYSFPLDDIEYIGYFYGNKGNEDVKSAKKRITKERGRTPDFLFNAELFDFKSRAAASDVVSQGKVHRLGETFGFAFKDNKTPVFSYKNNVGAPDYVGAYPLLVKDGKAEKSAPSGISGRRGRTAMGLSQDSMYVVLVPDKSGATLTELRSTLIKQGVKSAINLDGGGSTQFYAPLGNYFSGRRVRGFVGIWIKGGDIRRVKVRTSLNIRSGPGILHKKTGRLYNGDTVTVLEEKGSWARINLGWVSSLYLVKGE